MSIPLIMSPHSVWEVSPEILPRMSGCMIRGMLAVLVALYTLHLELYC